MPSRICDTCKESTDMMKVHVEKLENCPEWKLLKKETKYFPNDTVINSKIK